jgi:hypothetical protein
MRFDNEELSEKDLQELEEWEEQLKHTPPQDACREDGRVE